MGELVTVDVVEGVVGTVEVEALMGFKASFAVVIGS